MLRMWRCAAGKWYLIAQFTTGSVLIARTDLKISAKGNRFNALGETISGFVRAKVLALLRRNVLENSTRLTIVKRCIPRNHVTDLLLSTKQILRVGGDSVSVTMLTTAHSNNVFLSLYCDFKLETSLSKAGLVSKFRQSSNFGLEVIITMVNKTQGEDHFSSSA